MLKFCPNRLPGWFDFWYDSNQVVRKQPSQLFYFYHFWFDQNLSISEMLIFTQYLPKYKNYGIFSFSNRHLALLRCTCSNFIPISPLYLKIIFLATLGKWILCHFLVYIMNMSICITWTLTTLWASSKSISAPLGYECCQHRTLFA